MKRREFLHISAVVSALLIVGCKDDTNSSSISGATLPIPPLLSPTYRDGVAHYDLTLTYAQHTFLSGLWSEVYAINGGYLGPTLLLNNNQKVSINYNNQLNEVVAMHGHGMHVPPTMDGTPHQSIAPNSTWSATYKVNQYSSTNWYHAHTLHQTGRQVYKGLAGMIIVEDERSSQLQLPNRYGIDDIPLILQDRNIDQNGALLYAPSMREIMQGYRGEYFMVNGAIEPSVEVENTLIRFRVLNASNSSVYRLSIPSKPLIQIATDSALLQNAQTISEITLSPGERCEVVVDFSSNLGETFSLIEHNSSKQFLHIKVSKERTTSYQLPSSLYQYTRLDPNKALQQRRFTLSGRMGSFFINNKSMDLNRIDEIIPLNQVEIWEIVNTMGVAHNFHVHATHFEIIDRNGSSLAVAPYESGLKDVVYIPAGERVRIVLQMTDYTDTTTPYMYHCHFLEHEDNGMMGQFLVV